MFIAPKIGFISPTHTFVSFQGIHVENVKGSVLVGNIPNTDIDVYVTNDGDNTDVNQPGSHKSQFEKIKKFREGLTDPNKIKEVDELFEQYKESLFRIARKLPTSEESSHRKKTADKNRPSTSNKKQILMSTALYGLLLSAVLWGEQQGLPK